MARKPATSSALFHKVAFLTLEGGDDGYGNYVGGWVQQFTCRAQFIHLRGGEAVMAGRLQGTHTQIIRVRRSSLTLTATTDWMVRDTATSAEFNVRDITPTDDRAWLDLLCESGVAT